MIYCVEDDNNIRELMIYTLQASGFEACGFRDGDSFWKMLKDKKPELVILDIMLPGKDGFEALAEIRKTRNMPVMIMSAKTDDESKILGMEIGADDYVEKTVSIPVLTSKIRALLRRSYEVTEDKQIISSDGITIDIGARTVYKGEKKVDIKGMEFDLLVYLMENRGQALRKETIFNAVWGSSCFSELSSLSVYISWLRDKIEDDPKNPKLIKTVYKIGYQFGE